jgi:hypothetical protein
MSGFSWGAIYLMPARMDTLALGAWLALKLRTDAVAPLRPLAVRTVLPLGVIILFT